MSEMGTRGGVPARGMARVGGQGIENRKTELILGVFGAASCGALQRWRLATQR